MARTKTSKKDHKIRKILEPYFLKIVNGDDDAIQCPLLALKFKTTYGSTVMYFSEFMRDRNIGQAPKESKIVEPDPEPIKETVHGSIVKAVFRTPDAMVQSYGMDNKSIKELSGPETKELLYHIKLRSTDDTKRHGFEEIFPDHEQTIGSVVNEFKIESSKAGILTEAKIITNKQMYHEDN